MIARITGRLLEKGEDFAVVDVQGVGYLACLLVVAFSAFTARHGVHAEDSFGYLVASEFPAQGLA